MNTTDAGATADAVRCCCLDMDEDQARRWLRALRKNRKTKSRFCPCSSKMALLAKQLGPMLAGEIAVLALEHRLRWRLACAHGHRYFLGSRNRIAVADESGEWPDQTDDGLLFLDLSRSIMLSEDGWLIPLRHGTHETVTIGSWPEVVLLAMTFGAVVRRGDKVLPIGDTLRRLLPQEDDDDEEDE